MTTCLYTRNLKEFQMTQMKGIGIAAAMIFLVGCSGLDDEKLSALSPEKAGRKVFEVKCMQCHALQGEGGTRGPDLSDVGERIKPDTLKQFIRDPQSVKPNGAMRKIKLSDKQIDWVAAYLSGLK